MKKFLDAKCCLKRLSDGSLHYGWVKEVIKEEFRITLTSESDLNVGDVCELMLSAEAGAALFKGSVLLVTYPDILVTMPQRILVDKAAIGVRTKVQI